MLVLRNKLITLCQGYFEHIIIIRCIEVCMWGEGGIEFNQIPNVN